MTASATVATNTHTGPSPQRARVWRALGWVCSGLVLALSFLAYLSPGMQLQWETLAALCGF